MTFPFIRAQTSRDTISIIQNTYWYRGDALSANQLLDKMQYYPAAYSQMSIAKVNYDIMILSYYIGGFCVGYPVGQAIGGGKPLWALGGVGVGVIILSIPLYINYNKHARKAVGVYNASLTRFGLNKLNMKIGFSPGGIRLCCRF